MTEGRRSNFRCPNCGGYVDERKVDNCTMWFCMKENGHCAFCTSFEDQLKKNDNFDYGPLENIKRKPPTEEEKRILARILIF